MGLVYELTDLQGRVLTEYEDRFDVEVYVGRNKQRTAKCSVSMADEDSDLARPLSTRLRAYLDGQPIYNGPAVPKPVYHEGRVEIASADPGRQLEQSFVKVPGSPPRYAAVNPALSWSSFDQGWIIQRLVEHARPTAGERAFGVPDHGIGIGSIPLTKNRARSYEPGKQIWEAIIELTDVIAGPDVELVPVAMEGGTAVLLNVYASQGKDRSADIVFQYGTGDQNCTAFTADPDAFATRNRFTSIGQAETVGETEIPPPTSQAQNVASIFQVGIWEGFEGRPDVSEAPTLAQHAQGEVGKFGVPPVYVDLTPTPQGPSYRDAQGALRSTAGYGQPPVFGPNPTALGSPGPDYWIGDLVYAEARRDGHRTDGVFRVEEATITEADQLGTVQVALVLAPLVLAAD